MLIGRALFYLSFFVLCSVGNSLNDDGDDVCSNRRRRQQECNEQNVTLIMIVVILTFMVCNVPAKVVQAVWSYQTQPCMSAQFFLSELSIVLEVFSSAVNFFVYCAFLRRFRRRLVAALCCRGGVANGSRDDRIRSEPGSTCTMQPLANTTAAGADGNAARTVEIVVETSIQIDADASID